MGDFPSFTFGSPISVGVYDPNANSSSGWLGIVNQVIGTGTQVYNKVTGQQQPTLSVIPTAQTQATNYILIGALILVGFLILRK